MKRLVAPALLAVLCLALLIKLPFAIADRSSAYEWFDPIIDVRQMLMSDFVREPDVESMQRSMIGAMVESVNDPYTVYVPPANEADFTKELRGTYVGIGAEVNVIDDYLTIISPMDDSPALEAGVMAGDVVLEIEGQTTFKKSVDEAIDMLVGEPGTPVTIRVRHTDGTEQDITIVRRQIQTRSVKGVRRIGEEWNYCINQQLGLGYIRITQFLGGTIDEVRAAIQDLRDFRLEGLILDLRDNPGGSLAAAVEMSDLFLDDGVIVTVKGRNAAEERSWRARSSNGFGDFPMIVLINGNSASASEIVSGALQENGRAKVIGTRSFGKGSVQEVRPLPFNRGTLKFTTAYYYLPSGRNLNKLDDSSVWGVDPDPGMVVRESIDEYRDRILARRAFEIIEDPDDDADLCADAAWVRDNLLDEQLASAVEVLSAMVTGAEVPTLSEVDPGLAAISEELENAGERRRWLLERLALVEEQIESLQSQADAEPDRLIPDDVDLADGTIEVRDAAGQVVGTYRLEAGDLNLALRTLRLRKVGENGSE